jgi:hypothetical protein
MRYSIVLLLFAIVAIFSPDKLDTNREPAATSKSTEVSAQLIKNEINSLNDISIVASKYNLIESEYQGYLSKRFVENFITNDHLEETILIDGENEKTIVPLENIADELYGTKVSFKSLEFQGKSYGIVESIDRKNILTPVPVNGENEIVFLVDYNDSSPPHSPDPYRPILERHTLANQLNTKFFNNFVTDIFRGARKTTITKVVGWHRIQRKCTDTHYPGRPGNTGYMDKDDMRQLFYDRGIDHTKYDHVSIIVSCLQWHSWGDATLGKTLEFPDGHKISFAKSYVGFRRLNYGIATDPTPYLSPNKNFMRVFLHERVHAFGFGHSGGVDCGLNTVQFPCVGKTYGNPFDTMGSGVEVPALNADVMRRKEIRDESQYLTVDSPGIYEISPLLSKNPSDKIGIYIKSEFSNTPVYMLENRTAMSVDRALMLAEFSDVRNGITILSAIGNSMLGLKTKNSIYDSPLTKSPKFGTSLRFIDANPSSHNDLSESFYERSKLDAITRNNIFFDPITGIKIQILRPTFKTNKKGNIRFQLQYHADKRVCFKGQLVDQMGAIFLKKEKSKYSQSFGAQKNTVVYPGDEFRLKVISKRPNPLFCPRDRIEIKVLNPEVLEAFNEPRDPNGNPGTGVESGPGGPGHEGGGAFTIRKTVEDYNKLHDVSIILKTPSLSRTDKEIVLNIQYKNLRTDETSLIDFTIIYKPNK